MVTDEQPPTGPAGAGDSLRLRVGLGALVAVSSSLAVAIVWMLLLPLTPDAVGPTVRGPAAEITQSTTTTDTTSSAAPSATPSAVPATTDDRVALTVGVPGERAIAYLTIPDIGLNNVPIYDRGLDSQKRMLIAPGFAVTHYTFSGPLGGGSNAVLYGHDDIQGSVFARLSTLKSGARFTMRLASGTVYNYVVQGNPSIVLPTAVQILNGADDGRLTLFTCFPNFVDNHRVVVVALPTIGN